MAPPLNEYRKKHLTEFEKEAYRRLHRAVVLEQREGGAWIDTHQSHPGCGGACDQGRKPCNCQVGQSEMPSPLEPQPVQISKPSLWQRLCAWYRKHIDNGKTYD